MGLVGAQSGRAQSGGGNEQVSMMGAHGRRIGRMNLLENEMLSLLQKNQK